MYRITDDVYSTIKALSPSFSELATVALNGQNLETDKHWIDFTDAANTFGYAVRSCIEEVHVRVPYWKEGAVDSLADYLEITGEKDDTLYEGCPITVELVVLASLVAEYHEVSITDFIGGTQYE